MITSAGAVHLNDLGLELWIQRKSEISSSRSSTIEKLPLLIRLVVIRAKKRSTRFSQEHIMNGYNWKVVGEKTLNVYKTLLL
ncbi:MAG: hypothetical protein NTU72_03975 [Fimbriimonadales bacterium]|nr:hypothetical protein [Fimbriimonadales bacterium]